jgi:hypothetical protein
MFAESLGDFFDPVEGFAEAAVYDGTLSRNVIFDHAFLDQFGTVSGARTVALGIASEFPSPIGKTLLVKGVTYTIVTREPQDDGALVLMGLQV